jgi:hypothetical protein
VSTNSICQEQQVPILWLFLFASNLKILFAYPSLQWNNLATNNAGVTVVIVGMGHKSVGPVRLFVVGPDDSSSTSREVDNINAHRISGANVIVSKVSKPVAGFSKMARGNTPIDGGNFLLNSQQLGALRLTQKQQATFITGFYSLLEFIRGLLRYCIGIKDEKLLEAE